MEVEWRAYELHPEIPPEGLQLPPEVRPQMVGMSEHLKQMAREAGMEMVMPEMIPNSRRALEAAEYAREQGRHEEFHTGVFCQLYEKGQDIGRWDVLRAAAAEAGLDPKAMQQETESGRYQSAVDQQVTEAWSLGITGVPAYILNGKFAIIGVQPYEVFQEAMERLVQEAS